MEKHRRRKSISFLAYSKHFHTSVDLGVLTTLSLWPILSIILLISRHGYLLFNVMKCYRDGLLCKHCMIFFYILGDITPIMCLHETHLVPDKTPLKPRIQWSIHSSHSSYSRGDLGQILKDSHSRFVLAQAWIDSHPYVILGISLPPAAALSVLRQAA